MLLRIYLLILIKNNIHVPAKISVNNNRHSGFAVNIIENSARANQKTNQLYSSNNTGKCKIMTYKKWKHNQQVTEIVPEKLIM